ncbi:hypothetical protein [Xenorhabdus griffiniae]|uniref:Uncharacterized protein n=1 Tax=Xenorhabdus griffiniae TaxID=351672 RepID=A0ABY9XF08_9GAMM|nr:hypothetical protein [Xenorhabdus griffiniae]MBD1228846.1 hypothetical protein [Xenorhabdus griffiniae]MBE8588259.1 hypothetical protein [Xenorhabdus griffiniae]WMV71511.1 hypothetical protein QL128_15335 [Xenorhabdus griffiniae]WNH01188.1 hypothetical protein QL112_015340 [Xenorhabdus griffiniae]
MEKSVFQWLFSASQPYCLQINRLSHAEPVPVQLYWWPAHQKASRLYLVIGNACQPLDDGDFTVWRLSDTQWQSVVAGNSEAEPEQWERLPFTVSELAVHPEFAAFTAIGTTETEVCGK